METGHESRGLAKRKIAVFGSLLLTPVCLFISTTLTLYINNQMDLGYSYQVLYPFLWLFVIAVAVGLILYRFSGLGHVKYILRLYYGIGPFFILYTLLRNLSIPLVETAIVFIILAVLFLGIFIFLAEKAKESSFVAFFAFLGFFFLAFEAYSFYTGYQDAPKSDVNYKKVRIDASAQKLPNIYLLLLDGFQTEMFDVTLTPQVKKSLGGFVQFHENTALFGRTLMSIPSIFGGRSYDFNSPQVVYKESSFTSDSSTLSWLKKAGYTEHAYVMDKINEYNNLSLFDSVIEHENKRGRYTPHSVFFGAWAYRNLPLFASTRILGAERLERIKGKDTLPRNASVSSVDGFFRYLENEKDLPASNRFTFLYMLLPHKPFIFNDDCSFSNDMALTGPISQSKCATNLIVKFIKTLKELDRFNDSMIIITADHGLWYKVEGGELKKVDGGEVGLQWATSRALLLMKPAGIADADDLIISGFQSSLLDIAPTIAASLPDAPPVNFEGTSLLNPIPPLRARKKYYYTYEKKAGLGWTDEMTRFIIEDNKIQKDGLVKIKNNGSESIARNNNGNYLLKQGKAQQALEEFRKALSFDPDFDRARVNLAKALTILGQYDEAIAQHKTLHDKDPLDPQTLINLGINYTLQGKFEMAIENFERSIELYPSDSNAFYNYALPLTKLNRIDEAARAYRNAAKLNPQDFKSRNNLANILMRKNDLKGAKALYMEVLGLKPAFPQALNNLGIIMSINKHHSESLSYYKRAIKADPRYMEAYYNMGITLEDLGEKSEAIERYKEAVKIDPNYADAHYSLANIYMEEKLYTLASNEFRTLLRINPQDKKAVAGLKESLRLNQSQ